MVMLAGQDVCLADTAVKPEHSITGTVLTVGPENALIGDVVNVGEVVSLCHTVRRTHASLPINEGPICGE
jgi:hypothetical protein